MVEEVNYSAPLMLSSDAFDERDRFDAWREELMLRVIRVDIDVPDKQNFHTALRVLSLPNVTIIDRRSTPSWSNAPPISFVTATTPLFSPCP
jgi:hypothetical protein